MGKFNTDSQSGPVQIYLGGGNLRNTASDGVSYYFGNGVSSGNTAFVTSLNPSHSQLVNSTGLTTSVNFSAQRGTVVTSFYARDSSSYVALNPVPEPESWTMPALGLGALGVLVRRRGQAGRVA